MKIPVDNLRYHPWVHRKTMNSCQNLFGKVHCYVCRHLFDGKFRNGREVFSKAASTTLADYAVVFATYVITVAQAASDAKMDTPPCVP